MSYNDLEISKKKKPKICLTLFIYSLQNVCLFYLKTNVLSIYSGNWLQIG